LSRLLLGQGSRALVEKAIVLVNGAGARELCPFPRARIELEAFQLSRLDRLRDAPRGLLAAELRGFSVGQGRVKAFLY
jgi:hypothetical protein